MLLTQALLVLFFLQLSSATAATSTDMAIRLVLKDVEDASNQRDSARILSHVTSNIVMVSKNGSIEIGRTALASYLDKMFGIAPSLEGLHSRVFLTEPSIVFGQTAIATGTSEDEYAFTDGMKFKITTIWSATLVQAGGKWKIASIHFSFNLFDNPLLNGAKYLIYVTLIACLFAGVVSGGAVLWYAQRRCRMS